jgi:hypothetical protein
VLLGGVVLLCVLAAAATWLYTRNQTPDSGSAASVEPARADAAPPLAAAPAPVPTPVPEAEPAPLPPMPNLTPTSPAPANKPAELSEAEVRRLVARLQQAPAPASCQSGTQKIRKDSTISASQASEIAKRAYPDLCNPASPVVTPAAPPRIESKSIDQLYEEKVAAECARGLTGVVCREIINAKLCNGRWSENPPAGQKRCYRIESMPEN